MQEPSDSLFDRPLVNQWTEICDCVLDLQILDDFEVKYLPLPKRYDTNINVPLFIDH